MLIATLMGLLLTLKEYLELILTSIQVVMLEQLKVKLQYYQHIPRRRKIDGAISKQRMT